VDDQLVQSNLVLAGEDPVAVDSVVAHLLGYNPWDMEYLHMAAQRGMGTRDLAMVDVNGGDAGTLRRRWAKPKSWYGRGNRLWRVTDNPEVPPAAWKAIESPTDTLALAGRRAAVATRIQSQGHAKAFLWIGASGRFTAYLNGRPVMAEESRTRYRHGQYQQPVELRSGSNELVVHVEALDTAVRLSAYLVGPRNDGDTLDGGRWMG